LIIPKTYGVPDAFLGVPNTELPAAAELLAVVLDLPELPELQPAAVNAIRVTTAALNDLRCFISVSS
jgi:hypothetical protein